MCTKLLSAVLGISTRIGLINRAELIQEGTMESLIPWLHRVRAIELKLDDDPAGVCGWLKDQDDVPEVYVEDGSVYFFLSGRQANPHPFVERCREAGFPLRAYREHEVLLDEVHDTLKSWKSGGGPLDGRN